MWEQALSVRSLPVIASAPLVARRATVADSRQLWTWRNDPATRAGSKSHTEVPWDDHHRWFTASLARTDRILLVVQDPVGPVGTVRWDLKGPDTAGGPGPCRPGRHGPLGPQGREAVGGLDHGGTEATRTESGPSPASSRGGGAVRGDAVEGCRGQGLSCGRQRRQSVLDAVVRDLGLSSRPAAGPGRLHAVSQRCSGNLTSMPKPLECV